MTEAMKMTLKIVVVSCFDLLLTTEMLTLIQLFKSKDHFTEKTFRLTMVTRDLM